MYQQHNNVKTEKCIFLLGLCLQEIISYNSVKNVHNDQNDLFFYHLPVEKQRALVKKGQHDI